MSIEKFTIPVLTTSNYSAWAIQMEHILCVQSIWEVVSGDEKEPKKNDPKYASEIDSETDQQSSSDLVLSPEQQLSLDQDCKVYKDKINRANAILFSNMSQTIVEEHKKYKIPFVLWDTLQKRYAPRTTVNRISAGCDFANAHMNCDSESVPEYLTRLQRLRDHFADCGGVVDEAMYKGKMFERLPEGYDALAVSVMLNGDRVSPEEVKDQIFEHYRLMQQHTNGSSGTSNTKAYTAQQRANFGSGKSSNGNGNTGGHRGKSGKFGGGVSKPGKEKENAVDLERIMLVAMIKRNKSVSMTLAVFAVKGVIGRGIV